MGGIIFFSVGMAVGVGGKGVGGTVTETHFENSEVLPSLSVAVEVRKKPCPEKTSELALLIRPCPFTSVTNESDPILTIALINLSAQHTIQLFLNSKPSDSVLAQPALASAASGLSGSL
jgi:hypothetical protein